MSNTKSHLSLRPSMLAMLPRENDLALPAHRHIDRQRGRPSLSIRIFHRTNHRCTYDLACALQNVGRLSVDWVADEESNRESKIVASVRSNHAMLLIHFPEQCPSRPVAMCYGSALLMKEAAEAREVYELL